MHEPETWRELLGHVIENPRERQRLVEAMGINQVTLSRWANNTSTPRPSNLRRLLDLLPAHSETLLPLIEREFPDFFFEAAQNALRQPEVIGIPLVFYTRVLHEIASIPKNLLFPLVSNLIFQQALEQLDSHRLGMAISLVSLMPPGVDGKIHSLREIGGKGSPPWPRELEYQGGLLGAESLAGVAVTTGRLQVNQELEDHTSLAPGYPGPWEKSAAAAPILRSGEVAGCVLVSSTQPNYFVSTLCALIENYTELLAGAFAQEDYHPLEHIALGIVPRYEAQRPSLFQVQRRIAQIMREAMRDGHPVSIFEADQIAWRQIEDKLLNFVP